jgi:hypothetical protein
VIRQKEDLSKGWLGSGKGFGGSQRVFMPGLIESEGRGEKSQGRPWKGRAEGGEALTSPEARMLGCCLEMAVPKILASGSAAIRGQAYCLPMTRDLKLIMGKAGPGSFFLHLATSSCPRISSKEYFSCKARATSMAVLICFSG